MIKKCPFTGLKEKCIMFKCALWHDFTKKCSLYTTANHLNIWALFGVGTIPFKKYRREYPKVPDPKFKGIGGEKPGDE